MASGIAGKAMVIVVPGRTDRAFYKALLRGALRLAGASVTDLDSSRARGEKEDFLRRQVRLSERVVRVAALRADRERAVLRVAILDAEGRVVDRAADILSLHGGFRSPSIHALAVVDDPEERSFEEALQSLHDALTSKSRGEYDVGKLLGEGATYRLYSARRPPVALLLIAQGVPTLSVAPKHAVEDYVLYVKSEKLEELRGQCRMSLRNAVHKKLALLLAVACSYTSLETFIYHELDDSSIRRLLSSCPELAKLRDVALTLLERAGNGARCTEGRSLRG